VVPGALQVARLGGDEFAVLLASDPTQDVTAAAHRILREIDRSYRVDGVEISLSASLGVVTCAGKNSTAEELLQSADTAMYNAKRSGHISNRVMVAPDTEGSSPIPAVSETLRSTGSDTITLPPRDARARRSAA
jgi:GGDEF domain-containing protein